MQKIIELNCQGCNKQFSRRLTEHNRNQKLKREIYCSIRCAAKYQKKLAKHWGKHNDNLRKGRICDDLSPFRNHLKNIKEHNRTKKKPRKIEITLQDLKQLWEKQNGRCPYTGWELENPQNTFDKMKRSPRRASVDRIDSNKDYTKDNIEFVSLIAQYAKNTFSKQELIDFCKTVADYNK